MVPGGLGRHYLGQRAPYMAGHELKGDVDLHIISVTFNDYLLTTTWDFPESKVIWFCSKFNLGERAKRANFQNATSILTP